MKDMLLSAYESERALLRLGRKEGRKKLERFVAFSAVAKCEASTTDLAR